MLLLKIALASGRPSPRRRRRRTACAGAKLSIEAPVVSDEEVAALGQQAAQLRASVATLEEEQRKVERSRRLDVFNVFDIDRSGGVCAQELQTGWQKVSRIGLDTDTASRLLRKHDENQSGELEFDEFCVKRLEATLEAILAEKEAEDLVAREKERARQEKLVLEQQVREYYESLPGNQDTALATRIIAVLAYFLPMVEASELGLPLGILFPPLLPGLDFLHIAKAIPFGTFGLFLFTQWIGNRKDLPALLRFNFHQAAWLDVAASLINLATQLINNVDAPWAANVGCILNVFGFLLVSAGIAYSVASTLLGNAPRGLPWASARAEESMGMKLPSLATDGDDNKE